MNNDDDDGSPPRSAGLGERKHSLLCGLERANSPETELLQPPQSSSSASEAPRHV